MKHTFLNIWPIKHQQSYLSLQICLFLNLLIVVPWTWFITYTFVIMFHQLEKVERTLTMGALIFGIPIEYCRIYLGYSANLINKLPDLGVFWLISTFIQTPIQLYHFHSSACISSLVTIIIHSITYVLLMIEIIIGFISLRQHTKLQAQQYLIHSHITG